MERPSLSTRPGRYEVNLAARDRLQQLVVGRALVAALGPRDARVLEDLHHVPTRPLRNLLQLPALVAGGLVLRANPEVDADPLGHFGAPAVRTAIPNIAGESGCRCGFAMPGAMPPTLRAMLYCSYLSTI